MEILFLMVPLGMVLVGLGVWAFFWAVGSGQFDDLDSPGWSVLGDEPESLHQESSPQAASELPAGDAAPDSTPVHRP
jgi:cbb3-type cytochrome oxidase maturation protein